jgi:hypothetical protein
VGEQPSDRSGAVEGPRGKPRPLPGHELQHQVATREKENKGCWAVRAWKPSKLNVGSILLPGVPEETDQELWEQMVPGHADFAEELAGSPTVVANSRGWHSENSGLGFGRPRRMMLPSWCRIARWGRG